MLSYFPNAWKQANISAVLKTGKPSSSATSYRPISLLSVLGKLFEKLILPIFQSHLEENHILPSHQFGFRQGRSTIHQLMRVTRNIKSHLDNKRTTGLLSLDLQSAFDKVWHEALLHKMLVYNFPIYIIKLTKSYLEDRFFRVKIGSCYSTSRSIPAGVPQGAVLSPILFNIFVSDMPTCNDVNVAQFADDTLLSVSSHRTSAVINSLSKFGSSLSRYFMKWRISINGDKSESCIFTRKTAIRHQPQRHVQILGQDIEWKETLKYLGLYLDRRLTYKAHIEQIILKAERLIRMLYPLINKHSYVSAQNKLLIFRLYFRPIFCYGSPIWSTCAKTNFSKLQRLQNKILKMILNLHWRTSTAYVHELCNIPLLMDHINILKTRFRTRCQDSTDIDIAQIYLND